MLGAYERIAQKDVGSNPAAAAEVDIAQMGLPPILIRAAGNMMQHQEQSVVKENGGHKVCFFRRRLIWFTLRNSTCTVDNRYGGSGAPRKHDGHIWHATGGPAVAGGGGAAPVRAGLLDSKVGTAIIGSDDERTLPRPSLRPHPSIRSLDRFLFLNAEGTSKRERTKRAAPNAIRINSRVALQAITIAPSTPPLPLPAPRRRQPSCRRTAAIFV